jgi:hypothetical protein
MTEGFDSQLQQEIQSGLAEAFKNVPVNTDGADFLNITNPDTQTAQVQNTETTPGNTEVESKESSLTSETTTTETPVAETTKPVETEKQPEVAHKSFEELLSERSGGKFKDWNEIEPLLTSQEELDEEIKHLAELKKQGVKFDKDFWNVQTSDYENMTDAVDILAEAMRLKPEYKGWSREEIEWEIKNKYQVNKWSVEGEEPNQEQIEIESIMSKRMERDASNDKQWLIDKKKSYINYKKADPQAELQAQENERRAQENWEKFVDEELVAKVPKLSFKIDDNDSFDFEISASDKKDISSTMKSMTKDLNVFWNQFTDDKGNLDQKKVYELLVWNKNREAISKLIHQAAYAKGAEKEIRTIKNAEVTSTQTSATQKSDWREQARAQIEKNL